MSRRQRKVRAGPPRARTRQDVEDETIKSLINVQRYGDVLNLPGVREPFVNAWQRNLENAGARSPSLLAFSAVYACVTIISSDIAKLPLRVLASDGKSPQKDIATNHPINLLYQRPNSYQTPLEFMQLHIASKLMTGNSYIYKELDARGICRAMHVLHPSRVWPLVDSQTRNVFYQVGSHGENTLWPKPEDADSDTVIPSRFIIHDRMNTLWHPLMGVSPIFAAAASSATGARILMNSEEFFANMSRPSGVLTSAGTIQDVTAERLKREWKKRFSGGNIGETAVLGDGLSWEPLVLNAVDSQLIDQLRFTIEDVARVFRVPLFLLADLTKTSFRNSEQTARSYYQGCLQYHITGTEQRFNLDLGLDGLSRMTNFDLDALFRTEADTRFETYDKGIKSGVLSINEARAKEGLGPVKGGEVPRLQMQYVPIDQPVPTAAAPGAPAPEPEPKPAPVDDDEDDDEEASMSEEDMFYAKISLAELSKMVEELPDLTTL